MKKLSNRIYFLLIPAAWLAIALFLAATVEPPDPAKNSGMDLYLSTEFESQGGQLMLRQLFPRQFRASWAAVVFHRPGGLRTADLRRIEEFIRWLKPHEDEKDADDARSNIIDAPVLSFRTTAYLAGRLNSASGNSTLVVIGMPDIFTARRTQECVEALRQHLDGIDWQGLQVELGGDAGFYADYAAAARESVDRSTVVTILMVVIILLLVYRSPVGVIVPLATIATAAIVAVRLIYVGTVFGLSADPMIEMFVIVLLFGSGTDYCLFLFARYREQLQREPRHAAAMWQAWRAVAPSIAASAMTTIAGLSLMCLAEFKAFQKAGPGIGLALGVGCIASLTLAPALYLLAGRLLLWPLKPDRIARPLTGRLWPAIARRVTRQPGLITMLVLIVLLLPSLHAMQSRTSYNIFEQIGDDWSSFRAFHIVDREYKGGMMGPLTLLVRGNESLSEGSGWDDLRHLTAKLAEHPMVAEVIAPDRPMGHQGHSYETPQQMHWLLWNMAVQPFFYSDAQRAARVEILLDDGPYTDASLAAARQISRMSRDFAETSSAINRTMLTGPSATLGDVREVSRRDFLVVMAAVLIATYVILLVLLRRGLLALALIAGTMLSFTTALGAADMLFVRILGHGGLDWKIHFFLLVLLVVVGVDYNIYICGRIREELRGNRSLGEAVRIALTQTGGIISACGLIVAGTFASMMFGRLTLTVQLGFALVVGIMTDTFIVRPLLVPAMVMLLDRLRRRKLPPTAAGVDSDHAAP